MTTIPTLDLAGVTTTTTQTGQTVKVTVGGAGVETVPVSAQLTMTLAAADGVTTTVGPVTVTDNRSATIPVGAGLKITAGALSDGRAVTVAPDGLSVTFPA